jgi:hypothetical protein
VGLDWTGIGPWLGGAVSGSGNYENSDVRLRLYALCYTSMLSNTKFEYGYLRICVEVLLRRCGWASELCGVLSVGESGVEL